MGPRTTRSTTKHLTELEKKPGQYINSIGDATERKVIRGFKDRVRNKSNSNSIHRYTQVNEDEFDQVEFNCRIPSVPGENEPIVSSTETTIPQCRLCLRRVSQGNLRVIFNKQKAKVLAAFRLKIYVNDAYPFACLNCLNLIDILLDFKQIVMKSKNLLLTQRTYLESDGWDESGLVETISNCKSAVERSRKQIDEVFEQHTQILKQNRAESMGNIADMPAKCSSPKVDLDSKSEDQSLALKVFQIQTNESNDVSKDENLCRNLMLIRDEKQSDKESNNESDRDVSNDDDDRDYMPEIKMRKHKRVTGNSHVLDSIEEEAKEEISDTNSKRKVKKGRSKPSLGRKPKLIGLSKEQKQQLIWDSKHQLCDFCGATVTSAAAESHKNKHLGIKPYKCLEADCELTFYGQINQAAHMKRVHGEKGMPVMECNICGQSIRGDIKVLNYHKKQHTDEKRHVCTVCGKGFTMKSYLRQHSVIHLGFPHKCSYCGKRFNNKWSMRTHEKNMHEKRNNLSLRDTPIDTNDAAS